MQNGWKVWQQDKATWRFQEQESVIITVVDIQF